MIAAKLSRLATLARVRSEVAKPSMLVLVWRRIAEAS